MSNRPTFDVGSALTGFAIGAVMTLLAAIAIVPENSNGTLTRVDQEGVIEGGDVGGSDSGGQGAAGSTNAPLGDVARKSSGGTARPGTSGADPHAPRNVAGPGCKAGEKHGATDVGVTDSRIKLGATVAETGIASNFLGEVRQAMEAVKNKVNRAGGVCGRQLDIVYKNDGWDPETGARYLQNLVQDEKVFSLAVVPSSEGLNSASSQGFFKKAGVPVVGSDGMIRTQYSDPYIWPVAAATTTTLHVMMQDAWNRGARNPAIAFESTYRFGVEGAYAFNQAFKRLSGHDIPGYSNPLTGGGACSRSSRFCGIPAGQGQYGNQVSALNSACDDTSLGPKCDFLVLLLEPATAQNWMAVPGVRTAGSFQPGGMAGAQPLFTYAFGTNCGDRCAGMRLWTGYNPPIEQYKGQPAVNQYVNDLAAQSAQADPFNQFTEGGYIGMLLLVDALKRVGPNLTRSALKEALDNTTFESGLTKTLAFAAGRHYANGAAQAFEVQARNGFTGWRFAQDYIKDPWLGQDAG